MSEPQELKDEQGVLKFNSDAKLGKGSYGKVVKGTYNDINVAVKIIDLADLNNDELSIKREEEGMNKLEHPNVLKLLRVKDVENIWYFVLELCQATLYDYANDIYKGPVPSDRDALMQMTEGLAHIHGNQLIHRDLSHNNILIQQTSDTTAVLKISDFGFCKPTTVNGSHSMSGVKGTECYISPELLNLVEKGNYADLKKERGKNSSDVFALGCLFYYYLTKGGHPFMENDKPYLLKLNIITGKHFINLIPEQQFASEAIKGMILANPEERWTLDRVKQSLMANL